jgi:soluble lytic murein transglycosylase
MRRESFYEADVISRANAYGLMQLLPKTAQQMADRLGEGELGDPRGLLDPRRNLRLGSEYLAKLLEESEGDVYQALASYNAGESNGVRWKERLVEDSPPEELILLISYSETRAYVYHVLRHWELYGRILPSLAP